MNVALKEVQKVWYEKLKEEGFEDIEHSQDYMRRWHCSFFRTKYTPQSFKMKQTYYMLASQFLESFPFERHLEWQIWKFHSEGIPLRKIAKETELKTCQIFKMIKNLKKKMLEMNDFT